MKNRKILPILFFLFCTYFPLLAQDSIPAVPNGVVLVQQTVVEEILLNYDSLLQTIDTSLLIHYDTVYMPVQYDENGNPIAFDYVVVPVKEMPFFPAQYDTTEVLMALITLPRPQTLDIRRLFFKLGFKPQLGYSLMDTVFQPSEASSPFEIVRSDDFAVVVVNLGSGFVGYDYYFGEVTIGNSLGLMSTPYSFSTSLEE